MPKGPTYAPNFAERNHLPRPAQPKHRKPSSRRHKESFKHHTISQHGTTSRHTGGHTGSHSGSTHAAASHRGTSSSGHHTTHSASHRPRKTKAQPNPLGPGWYYDATQNELVYDPQVAQYEQAVANSKSTSTGTATQHHGRQPKEPATLGEYDAVGKTSTWHHSHRSPLRVSGSPAHRLPF